MAKMKSESKERRWDAREGESTRAGEAAENEAAPVEVGGDSACVDAAIDLSLVGAS